MVSYDFQESDTGRRSLRCDWGRNRNGRPLEFGVCPKFKADSAIIDDLKVTHFPANLVAIAASWIVIEWISKIIISPLLQLTKRVGQISRDAGERLSARFQRVIDGYEEEANVEEDKSELSDDTGRLTRSFNRMLGYLEVPEDGLREYE